MFIKKKAQNNINESSATDTNTTTNTKKRKRSNPPINSNSTQKKLITLKLGRHLLSTIPTAARDDTTTSLKSSYMPSLKLRIRPLQSPPMPSDSTYPTVTLNDLITSPKRLNTLSKIALDSSTTTPIKLSNTTETREPHSLTLFNTETSSLKLRMWGTFHLETLLNFNFIIHRRNLLKRGAFESCEEECSKLNISIIIPIVLHILVDKWSRKIIVIFHPFSITISKSPNRFYIFIDN